MSRTVSKATIAGGLGGLINAALCHAEWPVHVGTFEWHIVPAGFVHGAVLAGVAVAAASIGPRLKLPLRLGAGIAVGLIANVSWYALALSLRGTLELLAMVSPDNFGAVSALLYLWLAREHADTRPWPNVLAGCVAGILGSLWFWVGNGGPWYLSPLHGSIWGGLVGLAVSRSGKPGGRSQRAGQARRLETPGDSRLPLERARRTDDGGSRAGPPRPATRPDGDGRDARARASVRPPE